MRFAALNPRFSQIGDDLYDVIHDCPRCGRPFQCRFLATFKGEASPGVWRWQATFNPAIDWNSVTLEASVHFDHGMAHGRNPKYACNVHYSIIDGEVI